jgi:hypothetical protein
MDVDFNYLRKKLIGVYNDLVKELHTINEIIPEKKTNYLKQYLDDLRTNLIILGCIFEEGKEDCKCILTESTEVIIYTPGDKNALSSSDHL